jgi:hypothetical protein
MLDRLCFVQFLHPGSEHWPDAVNIKEWTKSADGHGRKFLRVPGCYLLDLNDRPTEGEIGFWGEWEAPSEVEATDDPPPYGPRLIHRPFWSPKESYRGLHNTDPFVFGGRFFYTGCLQHTKIGPTQLRHLSRGSVILFGSKRPGQPEFTIDTVFVVAHAIDHTQHDYRRKLAGVVSETYSAVTLGPWYADSATCNAPDEERSFRLYQGATINDPVEGMFSFFPCVTSDAIDRGFARPTIHITGVITPTMTQNKRLNPQQSTGEITTLWREVVHQVLDKGLALGIHAALPDKIARSC